MKLSVILAAAALLLTATASAPAQSPVPKPPQYFNDCAGIVPPDEAGSLNETLAQNERDTSNQIVVAIFPKPPVGGEDIEVYAGSLFRFWEIGQQGKNNGALLLYYVTSPDGHGKVRIATGYGLEGALPDAKCIQIIASVRDRLHNKEYGPALQSMVVQMIEATKGENRGDGKTVAEKPAPDTTSLWWLLLIPGLGGIGYGVYRVLRGHDDPEATPAPEPTPAPLTPRSHTSYPDNSAPSHRSSRVHGVVPTSASRYTPRPSAPAQPAHRSDDTASAAAAGFALGAAASSSYTPDPTPDTSSYSAPDTSSYSAPDTSSFSGGGGDTGGGGAGMDV